MAELVADQLSFCGNCVQMLSNGEINDGTDLQERHTFEMNDWFERYWEPGVTLVVGEFDTDFAHSECGGCGTVEAGERWTGSALR